MDSNTARMLAAGVVGHLCLHHVRQTKPDPDWTLTTQYAARSFPDCPFEVIKELIGKCQEAVADATRVYGPQRVAECGELAGMFSSNGSEQG